MHPGARSTSESTPPVIRTEAPMIRPQNPPVEAPAIGMRVARLSAWYGKHQAIRDVTLDIPERNVTAIIGPSGCGKSTLVRCLNRMHEVVRGARAEGEVIIGGLNIYDPAVDPVALRREVGMVFQRANPFPTMTIFENVVAGLRLTGRHNGRELREVAERSLQRAALWEEVKDKLNTPGTDLSGGQQQRLCIARALAVNPNVLLMDEPASALDPVATLRIEELIRALRDEIMIVIVTHNMQQAARVSDQTAFMLAGEERVGELIEVGPTTQIFTNPRDKRTEDYITGRFG